MKRLFLLSLPLALLASCGGEFNRTYQLSFDVTDNELRQELMQQSVDVITRRLDSMETSLIAAEFSASGATALLKVTVSDEETANMLTAGLTEPFTFDIMVEAPAEEADVTVEDLGGFKRTGVNGDDVEWVQARQEPGSAKGQVRLVFTAAGRDELTALFAQNIGKNVGVFVRDRLVSMLSVQSAELDDDVVISGIPDPIMADVFADDVNVGLHVTFTPLP